MTNAELCMPYVNKNGKTVRGAAALNHYIHTVKGGVQEYNDEIGEEYLREFIRSHSDAINANVIAKSRRNQMRRVI